MDFKVFLIHCETTLFALNRELIFNGNILLRDKDSNLAFRYYNF